jgi:hypothetical protein
VGHNRREDFQLQLVLDNEKHLQHTLMTDATFDKLIQVNRKWFTLYYQAHPPTTGHHQPVVVDDCYFARNSIWMNSYFQKLRFLTPAESKKAVTLIEKHQQVVLQRIRQGFSGAQIYTESEFSTICVDPIAALMYAVSANRCVEHHLTALLVETLELFESEQLVELAVQSDFAGAIYKILMLFSDPKKRVSASAF